MFMTNSLLLWWTLDSAVLPLVIKLKVVKKSLQWIFRTTVRRTANLEKTIVMN